MPALYTMDTFHSVMLSHNYIFDQNTETGTAEAMPFQNYFSDYLIKNTAIAQAKTKTAQPRLK